MSQKRPGVEIDMAGPHRHIIHDGVATERWGEDRNSFLESSPSGKDLSLPQDLVLFQGKVGRDPDPPPIDLPVVENMKAPIPCPN